MADSDDEQQGFHSRHEISGTVDKFVIDEFNKIFEKEKQLARTKDRPEPNRSAVLEIVLRKGIKAYNKEG